MEGLTGRRILEQSFALIDRELAPLRLDLPPWALAVVRRMIHATADFDFARSLRYHQKFEEAVLAALKTRIPIVTDVEMVRIGIQSELARANGPSVHCFLNDPEAVALAEARGLTRSAAGIRVAAKRIERPILVIGNAPTALDEALRLVVENAWQPAAIVAIPVGFVGVEEAKARLIEQERVPYLTCIGRKGGSAVTAAAMNALIERALAR